MTAKPRITQAPMEFHLRAAAIADLNTIVKQRHAMFEQMGYVNRAELELTDDKFREWVEPKIESGEYHGWLLAGENGTIVAGAGLWLMEWVPHALDQSVRRGNILNLYCDPAYAEAGLLRRLLIHVLDYCRDNGIRTLIANPSDANQELYKALGFRPTGEVKLQVSVPN